MERVVVRGGIFVRDNMMYQDPKKNRQQQPELPREQPPARGAVAGSPPRDQGLS